MKYSVTSYSFQKDINAGKMTQFDVIAKAKELGFDGVEFTDLAPKKNPTYEEQLAFAKALRAEADRVGIPIVAYAIAANLFAEDPEKCDAEVERLCRQVDLAAILGAPVMRHDVTWSQKYENRTYSFDQMLPVIADGARKVTAYAEERGVRTCTENHGFIAQDSDRVERLYNAVSHPNYGLLVDVGNFMCADEDNVLAVSRVAPLAFHVHAKDFYVRPFGKSPANPDCHFRSRAQNHLTGAVVGEGDARVAQCIAVLRAAGYDGFVTLEFEGAEDPIDGITRGLANLKTY